jgi:hypothetical protein
MARDFDRPDTAPPGVNTANNATWIEILRQGMDSLRYEADKRSKEQKGRLESHARAIRENRETLVELVGRGGAGGLVLEMRESRKSQGERLEKLAIELGKLAERVGKGEASLSDLQFRTKVILGGIAAAMGAAGAGVAKLIEVMF